MSRIKGRYVAQVVIEMDVDENKPHLKTFDQLRDTYENQMTDGIKDILAEHFDVSFVTVTVEKQFADVWRADDEAD